MRKVIRFLWCVLLILAALTMAWSIIPKVAILIKDLPWHYGGLYLAHSIAYMFSGIGALLTIWLVLFSLWPWRFHQFKISMRVAVTVLGVVLILGAVAAAAIDLRYWRHTNLVHYEDYEEFAFFVCLAIAPIVACGTGYPGLIAWFWRRWRSKPEQKGFPVIVKSE